MPRRAKRRRKRAATLTAGQLAELLCGPSPRGTSFRSPAERDRMRRAYGVPTSPGLLAREALLDALVLGRRVVVWVDVLVSLRSGAEVLVTEAVIGRGANALIEGRVHGAGEVRFPKCEALRVRLAEDGRPLGRTRRDQGRDSGRRRSRR